MQRYFLHLKHLGQLIPDREGLELESIEAARDEAEHAIRDMTAAALTTGSDFTLKSIRICNGEGDMLAEVFSEDVLSKVFAPAFHLIWDYHRPSS